MSMRKRLHASLPGLAATALTLASLGVQGPPDFGDPLPGLPADLLERFLAGKDAFEDVEAVADGIGPVFNDTSCAVCHSGPATGGGSDRLETRFGRFVNGRFDPMTEFGGPLIQERGIGRFNGVNFVGEAVPRQATVAARRRTTPLFGLGLVGAVPDATFRQVEALEQQYTPETAGRVNVVADLATGDPIVGRFGWKCQLGSLLAFAADAYVNEMGITTPLLSQENCPQGNCALLRANPVPNNPNEPDNDDVEAFTDFMTFLAPPPRLAFTDQVKSGAQTFAAIGCINCHLPALRTGPNAIAALDRVVFFPFSDFLLHDMGALGDGIPQSGAGPTEMRTAPLWGLRAVTTFLHDGRAATPTQAILAHDGQGRDARDRFAALGAGDRAALLAFLNAL